MPESNVATEDTWVDGTGDDHSGDLQLLLSREATALVDFDLDATVEFQNLECNFWNNIESAELVVQVKSADCGPRPCWVRVRRVRSDPSRKRPVARPIRIDSGFSGEIRFDVTAHLQRLEPEELQPRYELSLLGFRGGVELASLESGSGPRIEVTNRTIPDETSVARGSKTVSGSAGPITISYLEAGEPDAENQILLVHGIPTYSIMWRNVIPVLARRADAHVIAPDLIGTGFSDQPRNPTDPVDPGPFDYFADTQAEYLEGLVDKLGMTKDGRKIILGIHEYGGLVAFQFATNNQDMVKALVFSDTYFNACPDPYVESAENPPPPAGLGVCRPDALAPFDLFPLWQFVIYPDPVGDATCQAFTLGIASEQAVQSLTIRQLSPALLAEYLAPYDVSDGTCDGAPGLLNIPRWIPVPVPGEPARSRAFYDDFMMDLQNWSVPKLFLVVDSAQQAQQALVMQFQGQLDAVLDPNIEPSYPNLEAACVGNGGHFPAEDVPYNLADAMLRWLEEKDLLNDGDEDL